MTPFKRIRRAARRCRYTAVAVKFMRENKIPLLSALSWHILSANLDHCTLIDACCSSPEAPRGIIGKEDMGRVDHISTQAIQETREYYPVDYINYRLHTRVGRFDKVDDLSDDRLLMELIRWRVDEVPTIIIREKSFHRTNVWGLWLSDNMCGRWFDYRPDRTPFDRAVFQFKMNHPSWCISTTPMQTSTSHQVTVWPTVSGIYGFLYVYFDKSELTIDVVADSDDTIDLNATLRMKMRELLAPVGMELLFSQEWCTKLSSRGFDYSERYVVSTPR